MTTYKVTTELNTKWWWTILRFFRLKNKREEFKIQFKFNTFSKGEIASSSYKSIKILGEVSNNQY